MGAGMRAFGLIVSQRSFGTRHDSIRPAAKVGVFGKEVPGLEQPVVVVETAAPHHAAIVEGPPKFDQMRSAKINMHLHGAHAPDDNGWEQFLGCKIAKEG